MLTTSAAYRLATRDLPRTLERTQAEPSVALETKYYLDNIGAVKSIDDLVKNTRLFTYAMKAFGLEDMASAKAFMRKVVAEGVSASNSFANRLADDRFVAFAQTFSFPDDGDATTSKTEAVQGVTDRYVRQSLETEAGETNDGVRLALYFLREAPTVKSAYGLLGDDALWKVIQTVFGFPDAMANADIEKQAAAVTARLDIADLKDPEKLDKLIQRFTAVWDATEVAAADPVLNLFTNSGSTTSVDLDLIMTLNSLKHGGA
ncbi:DUF1217 domain-containing protein [soil metagenome]